MERAQSAGRERAIDAGGSNDALDAEAPPQSKRPITPSWNLLAVLQGTLALVDIRAMNVTAFLLAGMVGLWTQLHAFHSGSPAILAWLAWVLLIIAILVMARVMLPHRLAKLSDWVTMWGKQPCHFDPEEETSVLAGTSVALRAEVEWLRKHLQVSVLLGVLALGAVVLAYVIQKI